MRGSLAKRLRRAARSELPINASVEAVWETVPRTQRAVLVDKLTLKTRVVKDESKASKDEVVFCITCTWRLATTCVRSYTQRFKRYYIKEQRA